MNKGIELKTSDDVPGPTKEEIRCLVMCKSLVDKDDVVLEIGSGSGGLTVEFALKAGKVYSIDKNPQAINLTLKNLELNQVIKKVEMFHGDALQEMDKIPNFDILMVGGSSGDLTPILEKGFSKLNEGGRIIITAILIETRAEAIKSLQKIGLKPSIIDVSISKGKIIERGSMMYAQNPVAIIYAYK
ncbi:MAG: precorrin-6Y C5,15-methyltransferase (decarboxylating) subunit CbiT [Methanomicrobiales archaeon]